MKVKKSKAEDDDLKGYVPLMQKQALYVALIIGLILILIGAYLLFNNRVSSSCTFTKYGSRPVTMNGYVPIYLGAIFIVVFLYGFYKLRRKKV